MSAASYACPQTGRLVVLGTFPALPAVLSGVQGDGVGSRYVEMESRGELSTLGEATVPVAPWLAQVMQHVEGQTIAALCLDRYKQAERSEEHTSELQSLMRISYAVFCLKKKTRQEIHLRIPKYP